MHRPEMLRWLWRMAEEMELLSLVAAGDAAMPLD
jgi:hypothetical protein